MWAAAEGAGRQGAVLSVTATESVVNHAGASEVEIGMEAGSDRLEAVDLECVRGDRRLFAGVSFSLGLANSST